MLSPAQMGSFLKGVCPLGGESPCTGAADLSCSAR